MALLEIDDIHVFYDKIEALKGVSLDRRDRQIVTLVGGNGAGKSTTLRAISGLLHPRQGEIRFDGRELAGLGAHDDRRDRAACRCRRGGGSSAG